MQRISIPWMLDISASLDRLDVLAGGQKLEAAFRWLYEVQKGLEAILDQSVYSHYLRSCREAGRRLYDAIEVVIALDGFNLERVLENNEVARVIGARDHFQLVLRSEISTLPVFIVTRKGNYDVNLLIDDGVNLFPPFMTAKVPETFIDASQVGMCLAFEAPTAAGFHTYRVLESVLRRYWDAVTDKKARPTPETMGKFAVELENGKFGDARVIETIKMIAKLYRNPLAHPDVILTTDEALGAISAAYGAITHMLSSLPELPPTTGAPLSAAQN